MSCSIPHPKSLCSVPTLPQSIDAAPTNRREATDEMRSHKIIFMSKNAGHHEESQPTRNGASPDMTLVTGKGSPGRFSPLLINARSMLTKIHCIHPLILSTNFDFMLTTVTWLNDHTSESDITIPGYKSFRKGRQT